MSLVSFLRVSSGQRVTLLCVLSLSLFSLQSAAQTVTITSPGPGSQSISAVKITASATDWNSSEHLEVWDNGTKLGDVDSSSANAIYVLPNGAHQTTVELVVTSSGQTIASSEVSYTVVENCNTSTTLCNMDELPIDSRITLCPGNIKTPIEAEWIGNYCAPGIQGSNGSEPASINIQTSTASGYTLNSQAIHFSEVQGSGGYSNVLFKANAPTSDWTTSVTDSNWVLDAYVYLPNPKAHEAFEIDAQYVSPNGVWTKFYTECAFNISSGTGFWEVYGGPSAPWVILNGQQQEVNGQYITPPTVACDRSQFALPWLNGPSTTGWHHIVWTFKRGSNSNIDIDGYPIFVSVTFDLQTWTLGNFAPAMQNSGTGEGDLGDFAALVQLDGAQNSSGDYDTVDAYVNEFNLTHTQ